MVSPKIHRGTDLAVLHALIGAHPLGTWITKAGGVLSVPCVRLPEVTSQAEQDGVTWRCAAGRGTSEKLLPRHCTE